MTVEVPSQGECQRRGQERHKDSPAHAEELPIEQRLGIAAEESGGLQIIGANRQRAAAHRRWRGVVG